MVPWEVTLDNAIEWEFIDELIKHEPFGTLIGKITHVARSFANTPLPPNMKASALTDYDAHVDKCRKCVLPDISAVIALLYPKSVLAFKDLGMDVELQGVYCRGTTHIQWMEWTDATKNNVRIIWTMDLKSIKDVLLKLVTE